MHNEWVKEKGPLAQLRNNNLKSRRTRSQVAEELKGNLRIKCSRTSIHNFRDKKCPLDLAIQKSLVAFVLAVLIYKWVEILYFDQCEEE